MKTSMRTYSHNEELIAERRDHIAQSVAPLFVKKGYDCTSIREIAKACGMSMGALYYYVGSKEDVLQIMMDYDLHLYGNFLKEIVSSVDTLRPTDALVKAIDQFFRATAAAQDFVLFFYQETKSLQPSAREIIMERERGLVTQFEKILGRGCATGEFKIDNITLVANSIVIMGHTWALRRWLLRKVCTLDEYIRSQTEHVLNTILTGHQMVNPNIKDSIF